MTANPYGASITGFATYNFSNSSNTIYECGTIVDSGTYTLNNSFNVSGDCLIVQVDDVIIDGADFTITGDDSGSGIYVQNYDNLTVSNLNVENFEYGVYFYTSVNSSLIDSVVSDNSQHGVYFRGSSDGFVSNCTLTNNSRYGAIFYDYSDYASIVDSNLSNNLEYGVYFSSSSNGSISNSIFNDNSIYGLAFAIAVNVSVENCNVTGNSNGIYFASASNYASVVNCNVSDNSNMGVYFTSSVNGSVIDSDLSGNSDKGHFFAKDWNKIISLDEVIKTSRGPKTEIPLKGVNSINYFSLESFGGFTVSSEDYNNMVLWSPGKESGMLCIEPTTQLPTKDKSYFSKKGNFERLSSGETKSYSVKIQPAEKQL